MEPTDITFAYLQSLGTNPYVHGNGFIQLQTQSGDRYHFWGHPYIPRQRVWSPVHDHVFSFTSTVICGRLINVRYRLRNASEHHISGELYRSYTTQECIGHDTKLYPQVSREFEDPGDLVRLEVSGMDHVQKGQTYYMPVFEFHETLASEPTVSYMCRKLEGFDDLKPRVMVPAEREPDNEFNRHGFDLRFLWNTIKDILIYGGIEK